MLILHTETANKTEQPWSTGEINKLTPEKKQIMFKWVKWKRAYLSFPGKVLLEIFFIDPHWQTSYIEIITRIVRILAEFPVAPAQKFRHLRYNQVGVSPIR